MVDLFIYRDPEEEKAIPDAERAGAPATARPDATNETAAAGFQGGNEQWAEGDNSQWDSSVQGAVNDFTGGN